MNVILILTTTDKKSIAYKIGRALLKEKLIACYSILPAMESTYWWKGKITNAKEFQVILKTKKGYFTKIEKIIKKLHTYDLPEVISIDIKKAGKDYLKWINAELI